MGIYIKGMEMPKKIEPGLLIEFADGIDGKRYARLYHYQRGGLTDWLEAVPVPPHGDLIDRDETVKTLAHDYAYAAADMVRDEMPTIIPAEE